MLLTDKSLHLKAINLITYSMNTDSYRQDLIKKYALAQYHLGIQETYLIKHSWFGNDSLQDVPLQKLEKLIKHFRKLYISRQKLLDK